MSSEKRVRFQDSEFGKKIATYREFRKNEEPMACGEGGAAAMASKYGSSRRGSNTSVGDEDMDLDLVGKYYYAAAPEYISYSRGNPRGFHDDSNLSPLTTKRYTGKPMFQMHVETRTVDFNYIPFSEHAEIMNALRLRKLCVCSLSDSFPTVRGMVRVSNEAFDKSVFVRVTSNGWRTHQDVKGYYTYSEGQNIDVFHFEFSVDKFGGKDLEFAVAYEVNGAIYWDNNDGRNFTCVVKDVSIRPNGSSYEYNSNPYRDNLMYGTASRPKVNRYSSVRAKETARQQKEMEERRKSADSTPAKPKSSAYGMDSGLHTESEMFDANAHNWNSRYIKNLPHQPNYSIFSY